EHVDDALQGGHDHGFKRKYEAHSCKATSPHDISSRSFCITWFGLRRSAKGPDRLLLAARFRWPDHLGLPCCSSFFLNFSSCSRIAWTLGSSCPSDLSSIVKAFRYRSSASVKLPSICSRLAR